MFHQYKSVSLKVFNCFFFPQQTFLYYHIVCFQIASFCFPSSLIFFSSTMVSKQSFFEAVFESFLGTYALDCGFCTEAFVTNSAELNGDLTLLCAIKLSGSFFTDCSTFDVTLYRHSLPVTSAAELVVIVSAKFEPILSHFSILISSSAAEKLNSSQHVAPPFHPITTYGTRRRRFLEVLLAIRNICVSACKLRYLGCWNDNSIQYWYP